PAGLVWQVMRSHPRTTLAAAVLTVLHQFGEIAVPVVVGRAVDGPLADGDARGIARAVALLVVVFCLLALGYRFGSRLAHAALGYIDHEIRMLVTDRVTDHHGVGGGHRRPGDLRTVAGTDAQALARTKMLAVLPIGEIAAGVAASVAADCAAGLRVVGGFGASREATRRYERASRHALGTALSANVARAGLGGITEVVGGLFVVGTAMLAAHQTFAGRLTVGD